MNDVPLSIRAAMALSEGATFRSHLCVAQPDRLRDLLRVSIGTGHLAASGGSWKTFKAGVIRFIASEFDGELVITRPSFQGVYAARGMKVIIGPTILAPSKAQGEPN